MKKLLALFVIVALAGAAGWFAHETTTKPWAGKSAASETSRRVLYYQSPMHPWVKADQPGKCTVCGMDLVPVYEGEAPLDGNLVTLNSNAVTVVGVQTAPVRRQPLTRTLRFGGVIDDDDSRHRILSAYVDGRIDALFVHYEGAEVAAGQKLASFYSPMLLTAVREFVSLQRGTGASPASDNSGTARAGGTSALLSGAAIRLRQLGLSAAQIASLPATFTDTNLTVEILAPMSGTVVKRIAYAGQYVKEGDPLFELADFTTMWLKFDAYERDLAWLQPGQSVEITTPALPGRSFTNTVTFIDPNLDPSTRSAKVRVEIPNPFTVENGQTNRLFRHRLFADARVRSVTPEVLAVPRSAVLNSGGSPMVYVERVRGSYEPRQVQLGRVGDEVVEIIGGLSEGEQVVTQGNLLLDAQSQIAGQGRGENHSSGHLLSLQAAAESPITPHQGHEPATIRSGLNPDHRRALGDFLKAADAAREALAADDLIQFNAAAMKLHPAVAALPKNSEFPLLQTAAEAAHLPEAKDLPSARQAFYPLSTSLVEVVRLLRASDTNFATVKLYQCPMVKRAFPNAPKTAAWFQLGGPIRNPWFGADMIDCGSELKP